MGTPGYMSPEQADTSVQDVDTRTDVYSLGVLFYVLLTGSLPFDSKRGVNEVLRQVREDEPPRPSTKIHLDKKSSTGNAQNRGSEPRQLEKLLRGDLDWIAMKALEKDRSRRYGTPSDMAADINRYLAHEPVVARPASAAYRFRKYARRHRAALIGVSAFALVLIVATVVSVLQSIRARREAAVAQAVNDFLQNDLLAQASAENQLDESAQADPNITVRMLLDRAAQRMDGKFANQPEVKIALHITMGAAYRDLGVYPDARQQLERALELGRRTLGADDPRALTAMNILGQVAHQQGRYAEAQALDIQVLEARRRLLGPENPYTLGSMKQLAFNYVDQGKYAEAEALYAKVLEVQLRMLGPESGDTLDSRIRLADTYVHEGKYAQAETLELQTLEIRKRMSGPGGQDTIGTMISLANAFSQEGKYAQSEALFSQALEVQLRMLGARDPETALTKYNWGCMEARKGDKDKAIALLTDAVDQGLPPRAGLGMESDTDLTSLHNNPRFIALVALAKKRAAAAPRSGGGLKGTPEN
jgi:tetratricopeptide (TPR) repeat protein